jgi:hypothetical protein
MKSSSQTNSKNIVTMTLAIVIATGLLGSVTASNLVSEAFAQSEKYSAQLSGQEEVPPVDTQATGMAEFNPMGENVEYMINATGIEGVTAGHIHSGEKGANGPIVVTLFTFDTPQNMVNENGTITADMLEGPMQGKTISDLAAAMKNGSTYANIHTEQNPDGEIRGQIMSAK